MSALLDGILQDSPAAFMDSVRERFAVVRFPIFAGLLDSVELIQCVVDIVFVHDVRDKIERVRLPVNFNICMAERVIIIGACAAFDSKNFMGFAVGFAWQIEHCTGIKAGLDAGIDHIAYGRLCSLLILRHVPDVDACLVGILNVADLQDTDTLLLHVNDGTAQVHTDFVRIHNGATVILR